MTGDGTVRASDQDRERIAAALGRHYADGRLTLEEFQERLDRAYAAKTLGQLDDLMTDLPKTDFGQPPARPGPNRPLPGRRAPGTVQPPVGRHPAVWQFWMGVTLGVFVIWLMSGATGGPWFLWLAVPLGFIVLRRWLLAGERRIHDHQQDKRLTPLLAEEPCATCPGSSHVRTALQRRAQGHSSRCGRLEDPWGPGPDGGP